MINLDEIRTPATLAAEIASKARSRRREQKLSQADLAKKAGVSLGSLKRFENRHMIALESLLRIAFALGCEEEFAGLFAVRRYNSIQEVVDENA